MDNAIKNCGINNYHDSIPSITLQSYIYSIACINTFVTVDFNLAASTLTCVFQNKSSVERTCVVEYNTCDQEKENLENEGNTSLESPSEVLLSLMLPSGPNCYVYRVTASDDTNTVVVEGRARDDQSSKYYL